jgi:carbon-monoxide dehydrogenase medium subunit
VKPAPFEYVAPTSVAEAVAALSTAGGDAKVLAGGQSLVPLMNLRLARPAVVVDINRVAGLDAIGVRSGLLSVGALVRHADLAAHPDVAGWPLLRDALALIGHPAIRNRGTVGGSIAHADPAAELPAVLSVLGGSVMAVGPRGTREIPAGDLFLGYLTTALAADEILTEVRFPALPAAAGSAFVEFARRHGDFALVGAAAVVSLGRGGKVADARLSLIGVGPGPVGVDLAPLAGKPGAEETWTAGGELAAAACEPDSDLHGPAEYRRRLAGVMAGRALARAAERAR